jgi:hypothetical protein
MQSRLRALLLMTFTCAACGRTSTPTSAPGSLTLASAGQVEDSVRAFMQTVAHDVTQEGPTGWSKYFADTAAFFMAVDGHMVFPSGAAAAAGIEEVALQLKHIELVWGDDLRIDPLTPELAVVASSFHEVQVHADGKRGEEAGFFTGIAEHRQGRWQLRNAHWSDAVPPAAEH